MIRQKMFQYFKKFVPPISRTERIALQSGTLSLDRHIFENNVVSQFPRYRLHLREHETQFLNTTTSELCRSTDPFRTDIQKKLSNEVMDMICKNKFLGLCIPTDYDGLGFSSYAHSRIVQKISSRCGSSAVTVMVPNSLGPAELLHKYGTASQRSTYLPGLASGRYIPCFGLTGPKNGSDATGELDKAVLITNEHGDEFIEFQCNKRWITLAPISNLVGLAVDVKGHGVTLLLLDLERDQDKYESLDIGSRHYPIGASFMNGPIRTKSPIRISVDHIIGGKSNLGKGWEMLMECLSEGRGVSLPALSNGTQCFLSIYTSYYADARRQFKLKLSDMQAVQHKLAQINLNTTISLAMHELMNATLLQGETSGVLSAMLKYKTTELARETIQHSMDIFAGKGITTGPRNRISQFYSQIPIAITVEGSNTLTKHLIVFAQGVNKSHPFVSNILQSFEDNDAERFASLLQQTIRYVLGTYRDAWKYGLQSRCASFTSLSQEDRWRIDIQSRNSLFILLSNLLLLQGGKAIKRNQLQTGRMAELFTHLFASYAVLWYDGFSTSHKQHCITHLVQQMDYVIKEVMDELSSGSLSWVKHGALSIACPAFLSRPHRLSDRDWVAISKWITSPDHSLDDHLASFIYVDESDPLVHYRTWLRRHGSSSKEEHVKEGHDLRNEIIQVDDFHVSPQKMKSYM